jgi:hypothetical protein
MHDARAALTSLLADEKLDQLLAKAREQTGKLAGAETTVAPTIEQEEAYFDQAISRTRETANVALQALKTAERAKLAERIEKVALVKHMVLTAGRLLTDAA